MILSISVAMIAVAFLILVIYLVSTLKAVQGTLEHVSKTLIGIEQQLEGVTKETTLLLNKTNTIVDDVHAKVESLNTVVNAVKDVGTTITKFNSSLSNVASVFDFQLEQNKDKISQIVQWSNVFLELKDKWKARKKQSASTEINEEKDQKREIELQRLKSNY